MADKQINELDPVKEVPIGDLPQVLDVYDDSLIPLEQQGMAMRMTGKQFRQFGEKTAEMYVQTAVDAAADAEAAKTGAETARDAAAKSATNAAASETAAGKSKDAAAASQAAAKTSENNAETAQTAAEKARDAANTSETNAAASAKTATDKAAAASTSETNAKKSADAAAASQTAAKGSQDAAATSASRAASSATNAAASAKNVEDMSNLAESYAVGGTDTRPNEDADNAKYYYEQAKGISQGLAGSLLPMGTVAFAALKNQTKQAGYMYNISDAFTTDATFKEGAGYTYPAGTNVYYTADGFWDCLAGTAVTGVKGHAESSYRLGNVDLTPENIGALPASGKAESAKTADTATTAASCTGNAATATKLAAGKNISISGGATAAAKSFDGSAAIDLAVTALDVSKATAGTLAVARGGTGVTALEGSGGLIQKLFPANKAGVTTGRYMLTIGPNYDDGGWVGVSRVKELLGITAEDVGALPSGGNAASATKLATPRNISISGGATAAAKAFDGSAAIDLAVTALDVSKATAGTLPVARGGTGVTALVGSASLIKSIFDEDLSSTAVASLYVSVFTTSWADGGYLSLQGLRNKIGLGNTTGALPVANGGTGATAAGTALSNLGGQAKHKTLSLTLAVATWSASNTYTITATGVTASNTVVVSPAPASYAAWGEAGVRCTAQGANSLTFTATDKPAVALTAQVLILD